MHQSPVSSQFAGHPNSWGIRAFSLLRMVGNYVDLFLHLFCLVRPRGFTFIALDFGFMPASLDGALLPIRVEFGGGFIVIEFVLMLAIFDFFLDLPQFLFLWLLLPLLLPSR
jgi:hypothetical protein